MRTDGYLHLRLSPYRLQMHMMVDRGGEGAMINDEDVIGGAGELEKLLNETHALSILVGIVSLSLIVIIVMLCAKCRERKP